MKPTSIIFLIVAGVLLISGIVLCLVGSGIASANDIPLVNETIRDGDELTVDNLDEYDIKDIKINVEDITVNILSASKKSKIEFVNINPAVYEYTVANGKMEVNTISPYEISSFIKITENGSGFSGLRSYLHLGRYDDKQSYINIYIADKEELASVKVKTSNGDINIKDINDDCEFVLDAKNGNVKLANINSQERATVSVDKGDLDCDLLIVKDLIADVKKGNATIGCDQKYSFIADCQNGNIFFDEENMGTSVTLPYPNIEKTEVIGQDEEGNDILETVDVKGVKLTVDGGDINIIDKTLNNEE